MLNGKLLSIVKSQSLERRGVLYEVTIKHSPKSKRRQHGKGLGKNLNSGLLLKFTVIVSHSTVCVNMLLLSLWSTSISRKIDWMLSIF